MQSEGAIEHKRRQGLLGLRRLATKQTGSSPESAGTIPSSNSAHASGKPLPHAIETFGQLTLDAMMVANPTTNPNRNLECVFILRVNGAVFRSFR